MGARGRSVFIVAFFLAATCQCAQAILPFLFNGNCPNLTLANTFDKPKFSGRWYEVAATEGNPYINSEKCTYSEFTVSGSTLDVVGKGINKRNQPVTKTISMTQEGGTAKFTVTLPSTNARKKSLISDFIIMGSDYTSYACIFACSEFDTNYSAQFAWVYSRDPQPTNDPVSLCKPALKQVGQEPKSWPLTPQGGSCAYA
ncbi:crustacyanin-A1 subunit-like [Oratosquilla oratoria]|uniref:crustacyanin-A1 subunit-like n=1 Tax=Oratosquilla oratoria TaxID=337810 RepID=UPI003F75DF72